MQKTNWAAAELFYDGGCGAGMQAGAEQLRISISCSFTERCSVGEKNHKLEILAAEPTWRGREGLPEMCPLIFYSDNKFKKFENNTTVHI